MIFHLICVMWSDETMVLAHIYYIISEFVTLELIRTKLALCRPHPYDGQVKGRKEGWVVTGSPR